MRSGPGHPRLRRARRPDHLHRPRLPMTDDRWRSPLGTRYASPAMQTLWGEPHRIGLWRRLWLALAEAERELGLDIPDEALAADAGPPRRRRSRGRGRSTSAASATTSWRTCTPSATRRPAARPYLHLGATSAFVTDNADLIVMRDGLRLLLGRLVAVLAALEGFAAAHAGLPCLAYTHFQPAQLTTVGQAGHALDAGLRARRRGDLPPARDAALPRLQGHDRHPGLLPRALRRRPRQGARARAAGHRASSASASRSPVTGQTYPRKADSMVLDALSGIAQSAAKMAGDLRLLQHEGELLEPFESEQIGSSAMAYKRNPMRAERISGLARFVISLQANGAHTAASQWLERTLDDSANRRLTLPEAFLGDRRHPGPRDQHRGRPRGARGGDPPPRRRADAVHGHRALAHARRRRGRRPPGAARGDPAAQPRRGRGGEPGRAERPARPARRRSGVRAACRPARSGPSSSRRATPAAPRSRSASSSTSTSQPLLDACAAARRRGRRRGGARMTEPL